jgi:hypothetical protein
MVSIRFFIFAFCVLTATVVHASSDFDNVVFTWVDDNGATQSITQTQGPWTLPVQQNGAYESFPYLSTPGRKVISATAYRNSELVRSLILSFDMIDSSSKVDSSQCSNLIANSDMALGYEGYWKSSTLRSGEFSNINSAFGSTSALRFSRQGGIIRRGGSAAYMANENDNMNYGCLTPGSSWTINAKVGLIQASSQILRRANTNNVVTDGVACFLTFNCPEVSVTVADSSGVVLTKHSSRDYVSDKWDKDSFNEIRTTFVLPDTYDVSSIGSVTIEIKGYSSFADLLIDEFSIVPTA